MPPAYKLYVNFRKHSDGWHPVAVWEVEENARTYADDRGCETLCIEIPDAAVAALGEAPPVQGVVTP